MTEFKTIGLTGRYDGHPVGNRGDRASRGNKAIADTMQRLLAVLRRRGLTVALDHGSARQVGVEVRAGAEPKARHKAEPKAELKAEYKTEPKTEPNAELKAEHKTEPKAEHKTKTRTRSWPRGKKTQQDYQVYETGELPAHCDLLIVVGGDGSMLRIAKSAVEHQTPVIGVNRGRLGFLTDILPDELEAGVGEVLAGNYVVDERFLFDVYQDSPAGEGASGDNASGAGDSASSDNASDAGDSVLSDSASGDSASRDGDRGSSGNPDRAGRTWLSSALNDVVLHAGAAAQMIEFDLFVGADFVDSLIADGLIIATPTGSTAYALSAGGPIMHPDLDAIVLAPLNPHSLSSRPIVVAGDSEIRLVVADKSRRNASISCDGRIQHTADVCDRFLVRKKPRPLKLIHLQAHSFYESCRSKLGWGGSRKDEADD